jgi:phosphotransferase system enzyme I (PtsP)
MYRRKVMGVLVVQNKEPQDFSEAAESFLVTLCAQLSGVIAHAHAVGNIDVFRKPNQWFILQNLPRCLVLRDCIRSCHRILSPCRFCCCS